MQRDSKRTVQAPRGPELAPSEFTGCRGFFGPVRSAIPMHTWSLLTKPAAYFLLRREPLPEGCNLRFFI